MAKWPWIERTFSMEFPPAKMPDLLERVRGTPPRIEERIRGLSREVLTGNDGAGWSIQRNIGHLIDLEPLHMGRIGQILAGENPLQAALYQILILFCIAGGVAVGTVGVVFGSLRLVFDDRQRLALHRLKRAS